MTVRKPLAHALMGATLFAASFNAAHAQSDTERYRMSDADSGSLMLKTDTPGEYLMAPLKPILMWKFPGR